MAVGHIWRPLRTMFQCSMVRSASKHDVGHNVSAMVPKTLTQDIRHALTSGVASVILLVSWDGQRGGHLAALARNVAMLKGESASRDKVGHSGLAIAAGSNLPLRFNVCCLHRPLLHHDVHIHLHTLHMLKAMPNILEVSHLPHDTLSRRVGALCHSALMSAASINCSFTKMSTSICAQVPDTSCKAPLHSNSPPTEGSHPR